MSDQIKPPTHTRCSGKTWHRSGMIAGCGSEAPCQKNATVLRDGKAYCATHDPVRVAERDAKRAERYARESRIEGAMRALKYAKEDLADNAMKWFRGGPEAVLRAACKRVQDAEERLKKERAT